MNSVPCPGCGLPRQSEQVGVVPCPVCEYVARDPDPAAFRASPAAERPDPTRGMPADVSEMAKAPRPRKPMRVSPAAFVLGVAVGVLVVLGWQGYDAARQNVTTAAHGITAEVTPTPVVPPKPKPLEVAPPPRVYVAVAPMPHDPLRPPPARVTQVDHPNAVYTPQVPPGATVTLKGRAKTLRVPALERGAVLDTTELEVEDVVVFGSIDGGSRLRIGAAKKRVTFQGKIDNRSTVEVVAPAAMVMFLDVKGRDATGIAGGSVVRISASTTSFVGSIRDAGTRVTVTITRGGWAGYAEIDGAARFEYRKAKPADPDPVISRGKTAAAATVARVD